MQDPHKILSVPEDIDDSQLKKRYKKLCKLFHPDKLNNDETAVFFFTVIQEAYENIKKSREKFEIPMINSPKRHNNDCNATNMKTKKEKESDKKIIVEGTNITDNDIRILGEKLQDPWFHPSFSLTEMFGDVNIPKKKDKK